MAESETPLTDASISWHTAYSGYGYERIDFKMEHVEVSDCRAIERELREEIAASRAEVERLREALQEIVRNDPYNQSSAGIVARAALAAKETK